MGDGPMIGDMFGDYADLECGFPGSGERQKEESKPDVNDIPEIIDGCAVPTNHKIGIENEDVEYSVQSELEKTERKMKDTEYFGNF